MPEMLQNSEGSRSPSEKSGGTAFPRVPPPIHHWADLSMILSPLGVAAHQYADDTQAYVHGVASEAISLVEKILLVSDVIGAWLSSNRLGLNPGKTQFIWVGGRVQLSKIGLSILLERFPGVLFSTTVRDLGVTLDQEVTLSRHVGSVCRSCFYHLRQIRSVRRSLTFKAARTLMHPFIYSRIYYCSAIYAGVALAHVDQLQSVLNAATRLIGGIPKFGHISEFIRAGYNGVPGNENKESMFCMCMLVLHDHIINHGVPRLYEYYIMAALENNRTMDINVSVDTTTAALKMI